MVWDSENKQVEMKDMCSIIGVIVMQTCIVFQFKLASSQHCHLPRVFSVRRFSSVRSHAKSVDVKKEEKQQQEEGDKKCSFPVALCVFPHFLATLVVTPSFRIHFSLSLALSLYLFLFLLTLCEQ